MQLAKLQLVLLQTAVKLPGHSGEVEMVFVPAVESCRKFVPKTNAWANRTQVLDAMVVLPAPAGGHVDAPGGDCFPDHGDVVDPVVEIVMGMVMVIFPS